jgi:tetratricopeptide (TPR) repeat protein
MKFNSYTQYELYKNFRHIRRDDVYAQIRFYERHADELSFLSSEEHFTVCCYYANALFAAEDYERYLGIAADILEKSIIEDIQFVDGVDVYSDSLEKMAFSYFKLKNYDKALNIAKQLYKISAKGKKHKALLRKILKSQRPKFILNLFALSIIFAISWTICEISSLLVFESFYVSVDYAIESVQSYMLNILIAMITIATLGHYFYVGRKLKQLIK